MPIYKQEIDRDHSDRTYHTVCGRELKFYPGRQNTQDRPAVLKCDKCKVIVGGWDTKAEMNEELSRLPFMEKPYQTSTNTIDVIAIRKDQRKVNAPAHDTWGPINCDACKEIFLVGPSRIFGARGTEATYTARLKELLKMDHENGVEHRDEYDLGS